MTTPEEYPPDQLAAWLAGLMSATAQDIMGAAICPPYCAVTEPLLYIAWSAGYRQAIHMLTEDLNECPATAHR